MVARNCSFSNVMFRTRMRIKCDNSFTRRDTWLREPQYDKGQKFTLHIVFIFISFSTERIELLFLKTYLKFTRLMKIINDKQKLSVVHKESKESANILFV